MPLPRAARTTFPRIRLRLDWGAFARRLRRWNRRLRPWIRRSRRLLRAAPLWVQIVIGVACALTVFAALNLVYQVVRKPTEMFFPVSGTLMKMPAETWRAYKPLFRANATSAISPELLAALAQVEASGDPVARTYWRWRFSWNPFEIYRPASSAVGMYQMTDGAFAEARRYCIRGHAVVEQGCWFNELYTRVLPSHAVELTAIYLDRHVAAILADLPRARPGPQQKQELAALVHLCGAGPAAAFARNGFHLAAGARCGDHEAAVYLARVAAMKRLFLRLAAER